jgi:hypothetical protein
VTRPRPLHAKHSASCCPPVPGVWRGLQQGKARDPLDAYVAEGLSNHPTVQNGPCPLITVGQSVLSSVSSLPPYLGGAKTSLSQLAHLVSSWPSMMAA